MNIIDRPRKLASNVSRKFKSNDIIRKMYAQIWKNNI